MKNNSQTPARAHIFRALLLLAAATLGSCSNNESTADNSLRAQSQIVNENPAAMRRADGSRGTFPFAPWGIDFAAEKITFFSTVAEVSNATLTISGADHITCAAAWWVTSASGNSHFFLVGAVDASGKWSCWSFSDANGDRVPDQSTQSLLAEVSDPTIFISRMVQDIDTKRLYLLDRRCQDIWLLSDATGDGLPNSLGSQPFARATDYPELETAQVLCVSHDGAVLVPLDDFHCDTGDSRRIRFENPQLFEFRDSDFDGVADTGQVVEMESKFPSLECEPYAGQSDLPVTGNGGQTVQINESDSVGTTGALIGTGTTLGSSSVLVDLNRSLAAGEWISVGYAGEPNSRLTHKVIPAWPQVTTISPYALDKNGGTVSIAGIHFGTSSVFRLIKDGESPQSITLVATINSATSATVTIPSLTSEFLGSCSIVVHDPSSQDEDEARGATLGIAQIH